MHVTPLLFFFFTWALLSCQATFPVDSRWQVYPGGPGVGAGKRVVFLAGDEEYRSEEALPMLARLLSKHHGFSCVVLFSQNPATGEINPDEPTHMPGMHFIADADLVVMQLRFREFSDEDMGVLMQYVESGKPLIGIRTSTHPFNYKKNPDSPFAKWSWRSADPSGGFGKEIFGETWVAHHGHHGKEATRGIPHSENADHPILRGVTDVFGPTDVYAIRSLPLDSTVLLNGSVRAGMTSDAPAVEGAKNQPMHPVAWTRERVLEDKGTQRIVMTTMGAAQDWSSEDLRRLFMNSSAWCLELEPKIPEDGLKATMFGKWNPTAFGFGGFRPKQMPRSR